MKLGLLLSLGRERTLRDLLEPAVAAEERGVDSLWVGEDYYYNDAFAQLGAVAAVTRRATLGLGVTHPYTRNLALLALSAATVDRLSGGRLVLALARGVRQIIEGQMGIPYGSPLRVVREATELLRRLWRGEEVSSEGGYFLLRRVKLDNLPHGEGIPLYHGGMGPRTLQQGGRLADGVLLNGFASPAYAAWCVEQVRQGARQAGRDPESVEVGAGITVVVTEDRRLALEALRPVVGMLVALPGFGEQMLVHGGFDPAILPPLRRALRIDEILVQGLEPYTHALRLGDVAEAVKYVPDELVDASCVIGPPERCLEGLRVYAQAGVSHLILGADDPRVLLPYLERFRREL